MRVRIDEARRDDETRGIDDLARVIVDHAHLDDTPVEDAHVFACARRTGAVDDGAADDLAIEPHDLSPGDRVSNRVRAYNSTVVPAKKLAFIPAW